METTESLLEALIGRRPVLAPLRDEIRTAFELLRGCYRSGGKVLICGNGGSAADSDHIAGELLKGFRLKRPLPAKLRAKLVAREPELGAIQAERLQGGLPAIALSAHAALLTAFANDVDPDLVFAQQVNAFARAGDVLIAISTSGNSRSVVHAAVTAGALTVKVIGLTGREGGRLAALCDVAIRAPEIETSLVQELHLPIYHTLCAMIELEFYGSADRPQAG